MQQREREETSIDKFRLKKYFVRKKSFSSEKEKAPELFQDVEENIDFQRNVEETSKGLKLESEIVLTVLKQYFTEILKLVLQRRKNYKIVMYKFFYIYHRPISKYINSKKN